MALLEADVLAQHIALLEILQAQGKLVYKRINVSPIIRGGGRGKIRFSKNPMKGMPDIQIWIKCGPMIQIEDKSTKGKLSAAQVIFQYQMKQMGHPYYVLRSLQDLISTLQSHGVVVSKPLSG